MRNRAGMIGLAAVIAAVEREVLFGTQAAAIPKGKGIFATWMPPKINSQRPYGKTARRAIRGGKHD